MLIFVNDPPAVRPCDHCHITLVGVPSMSVTDAVSVDPTDTVPEIDTVPGSSTFVTVMVTVMESSYDGVRIAPAVVAVAHVHGHRVAALRLVVQGVAGQQLARRRVDA